MKKAILVIREFGDFSLTLIESGFEVINLPTIETIETEDLSDFEKKMAEIEKYDGVFFTSPKAAEVFLRKFDEHYRGKIYILGNRTWRLFENTKFEIVFKENVNTAEELINSFNDNEFVGKILLFIRGDKSLKVIPQMLEGIAEVDEAIVYKTVEPEIDKSFVSEIKENFAREQIDYICFFSPSGVDGFLSIFDDFEQQKVRIATIGGTTAEKARRENLRVDFIASNATDFASELIKHLGEEI